MAPSIDNQVINNQDQQKCSNCGTKHQGPCTNKKYLVNRNFECGCDPNHPLTKNGLNKLNYENHCCICKKGVKFIQAEWNTMHEGMIRCWVCKQNNWTKESDVIYNQQKPSQNQESHDNRQDQRRFPKLQCEYILSENIGPCNKTAKGFNDVKIRNYQIYNLHEEKVEYKEGPICD
jgi:hypothetical protein